MIPSNISRDHLILAIRHIDSTGVPGSQKSRKFLLLFEAKQYPPKYVVSLANKFANGQKLDSARFNGGTETNTFLKKRGFEIVEIQSSTPPKPVSPIPKPSHPKQPKSHDERCPGCKTSIEALLKRIYGSVEKQYKFPLGATPEDYRNHKHYDSLQRIMTALEANRGYTNFIRAPSLPNVDFFIPEPGFILEFDESQHFTLARKIALTNYPQGLDLGFPRDTWISLCEKIGARDNDPFYRDEQRAWYDTLRDFLPAVYGLRPTVRLYAEDRVWCSLNPDRPDDVIQFKGFLPRRAEFPRGVNFWPTENGGVTVKTNGKTLSVALVFPETWASSVSGTPPNAPTSQKPNVPVASAFSNESLDLVIFPEAYIRTSDSSRLDQLATLAATLGAHLLVGAAKETSTGRGDWQVLLLFSPDKTFREVYTKHSTAGKVAFDMQEWSPDVNLPILDFGDIKLGMTLCHDQYLGLLQKYLCSHGAEVWINPSYDNVVEEKWTSILRLRAVENGIHALCTLHHNVSKRTSTHPFGFGPDGHELKACRLGGNGDERPLSTCTTPGIYLTKISFDTPKARACPEKLPVTNKKRSKRNSENSKLLRISVRDGLPVFCNSSDWKPIPSSEAFGAGNNRLMMGLVRNDDLFELKLFFEVLTEAKEKNCTPFFWNLWNRLPCKPDQLVDIMMGRSLESCVPVVLSDRERIYEITELANNEKNLRRVEIENPNEATVDLSKAWGLRNSFNMVIKKIKGGNRRELALRRYSSLVK